MVDTAMRAHRWEVDLPTLLLRGLVTLDEDDLAEGNLTLELGLTLWMTRAGSDLPGVRRALFALRQALLDASPLDEETEPVPLMAGDQRTAVLSLAVYTCDLLARAAASAELSPTLMAEETLAMLGDRSAIDRSPHHVWSLRRS
jgi:hypothetical protein